MKLTKTASGKQTVKISRKEWTDIGKKAGWLKTAQYTDHEEVNQVGQQLISYGNYMQQLADLTDDIDDPAIQTKANQIMGQLRSALDNTDFQTIEDLLMQLDRLQKMWWEEDLIEP